MPTHNYPPIKKKLSDGGINEDTKITAFSVLLEKVAFIKMPEHIVTQTISIVLFKNIRYIIFTRKRGKEMESIVFFTRNIS